MDAKSEENTPNFIIKKTLTSPEAVSLLIEKFPWLPGALEEELDLDESYYAFDRFGDEVLRRMHDEAVFQSACDFITELAEAGDASLTGLLVTTVLETAAYNPDLSANMRGRLGPTAKDLLEAVESHVSGK